MQALRLCPCLCRCNALRLIVGGVTGAMHFGLALGGAWGEKLVQALQLFHPRPLPLGLFGVVGGQAGASTSAFLRRPPAAVAVLCLALSLRSPLIVTLGCPSSGGVHPWSSKYPWTRGRCRALPPIRISLRALPLGVLGGGWGSWCVHFSSAPPACALGGVCRSGGFAGASTSALFKLGPSSGCGIPPLPSPILVRCI